MNNIGRVGGFLCVLLCFATNVSASDFQAGKYVAVKNNASGLELCISNKSGVSLRFNHSFSRRYDGVVLSCTYLFNEYDKNVVKFECKDDKYSVFIVGANKEIFNAVINISEGKDEDFIDALRFVDGGQCE